MSVVLCLPAHLCVSPAASRGRPPTGTRQKRFTAAGLPISRVPLGATNPEQRGAAACSSQLAAQRSGSQRRPATAPSSSRSPQRSPEHRPDRAATVEEVDRPGLRPSASSIGGPARPHAQSRQQLPQPPADQHRPHSQPSAAAPASKNTTRTSSLSGTSAHQGPQDQVRPPLPW